MNKKILRLLMVLAIYPASVLAQTDLKEAAPTPTLTVTGHGEVWAAPDQAIIRLGVISQAKEASDAQQQSSKVVSLALEKFKQMNIPSEKITTAGLTLSPVFSRQNPKAQEEPFEPLIVAYRARNTLQVVIDDISKVGEVIDTGVKAGANQLEGLSFELKEDSKYKDQALRLAVQEARRKAYATSLFPSSPTKLMRASGIANFFTEAAIHSCSIVSAGIHRRTARSLNDYCRTRSADLAKTRSPALLSQSPPSCIAAEQA